ncbi:hypothetical protein POM88_016798 [Heracleum sosnowskyi]|uniref:Uncharacterized protein n=1 Tax=Heracleum sosnowskyi TaxID=360622 RepID=A0AAD8MTB4_9APIA|nr:hypothetical protein POM88_016798 [Heracleum sosnowskyi]
MNSFDKLTPSTTKKMAHIDVKKSSWNLMGTHEEASQLMEQRPVADTIKFCGTKRFKPQDPIIHAFHPTLGNPAAKEHLKNAHKKLEFQLGHNSTANYATASELRPFRNMLQEIPRKPTQARRKDGERDHLKDSSEALQFANPKRSDAQHWGERDLRLQNSLKSCDESDNRDLLQRLCELSPTELSMYAFELEKKAMQLEVEEGKEVQRMKELNIFGNSTPIMNPLQMTELWKSRK